MIHGNTSNWQVQFDVEFLFQKGYSIWKFWFIFDWNWIENWEYYHPVDSFREFPGNFSISTSKLIIYWFQSITEGENLLKNDYFLMFLVWSNISPKVSSNRSRFSLFCHFHLLLQNDCKKIFCLLNLCPKQKKISQAINCFFHILLSVWNTLLCEQL